VGSARPSRGIQSQRYIGCLTPRLLRTWPARLTRDYVSGRLMPERAMTFIFMASEIVTEAVR
jgi:hypothetical protein